jgi:hypothetical protein
MLTDSAAICINMFQEWNGQGGSSSLGGKILRFHEMFSLVTLVTNTLGPFQKAENRWYYAVGYGS